MTTVFATLARVMTLSPRSGAPGGSVATRQEKPPAAQTADSSNAEAIRHRVKEGQKVRVADDQGREWQGRIERFARGNLELLTKDRQRRDLPYHDYSPDVHHSAVACH